MATLGIDFGSSYSTVSWINPKSGKPEAVEFDGVGNVKMPSVMLATKDGFMYGFQASSHLKELIGAYEVPYQERMEMMANFILDLKRKAKPKSTECFFEKDYSHLELLKLLFHHLIEKSKEHCGSDYVVDRIVFSHPVENPYFPHERVLLIKKAFHEIGYSNISTMLEPEAAVKGYSLDHQINEGEGILVFDFGGGTIDVAYVKKHFGELKIVAQPKGKGNCGGQDIDYLLYEDIRKKIREQYDFDISQNGKVIDHIILSKCEELKIDFGEKNEAYETKFYVKGNQIVYRLSRNAFNAIISPKVQEAINVAKEVVEEVKNKNYRIDKVLLIGGSSKLTMVKELLSELVGNTPIETFGKKDIAVALGCLSDCTPVQQDEIPTPEKEEEDESDLNKKSVTEEVRSVGVIHRGLSEIQEKYKRSKQLKK